MITHKAEEFDLERFWTVESLGIGPPTSDKNNENPSQEYQRTSISREDDGGYIAAFPWKKEHPPLPSNYTVHLYMYVNGEQDQWPDDLPKHQISWRPMGG